MPSSSQLSHSVRRRILRRVQVQKYVNKAVTALNSIYFGGGSFKRVPAIRTLKEVLHLGQRQTLERLIDRVHQAGPPSVHVSHSGAMNALRVASSPYGDVMSGIGEVVPMNLDQLSIPEDVEGVAIQDLLDGVAGDFIRDPAKFMLQDPGNWGLLSDRVAEIRTYDDPKLKSRKFYIAFLRRLHDAGILALSSNPQGRVGSFVVKKKPKVVDGKTIERQRLILDCRRVNTQFRAPPVTELGSLAALGDIYLPKGADLHVAGADIKDCFYACRLPESLRPYFCFSFDITIEEARQIYNTTELESFSDFSSGDFVSPCLDVLPMGYSWSFFLVQALHVQACLKSSGGKASSVVLDSRPLPSILQEQTLAMPYCDNTHVLGTDPNEVEQQHELLKSRLQSWGFDMHEEVGPSTLFPTLGGVIDGHAGMVCPNRNRYWNLMYAFEYVVHHPVSSDTIQRLLGHAMVVLVLNRSGMGIFRSLYDFSMKGYKRMMLWPSAVRECRNFCGILPLLVADMRREWSPTILCSDASPSGYGICERYLDPKEVEQVGLWQERWRFKRLPPEEWKPRDRALHLDPFSDLRTARADPDVGELTDKFTRNEAFEEVPQHLLKPEDWKIAFSGLWKHKGEHITLKEGRALTLLARRLSRATHFRNKKVLVLVDNLALAFSAGKGRSCNHAMLRVVQKVGALSLACNFALRVRWIPSEWNVSDGPSRGANTAGYFEGPAATTAQKIAQRQQAIPSAEVWEEEVSSICGGGGFKFKGQGEQEVCRKEGGSESGEREEISDRGLQFAEVKPCFEGWTASKAGYDDSIRSEQCECGAAESVRPLPEKVQGLVQGERLEVATSISGRRNPGRLLRRLVSRGSIRSRGGEDHRSFRIFRPPVERQVGEKSTCTSGLAKAHSSQEQATIAEANRFWDSHEVVGNAEDRDGSDGSSQLRLLSETWGGNGSSGEEFDPTYQEHRGTVPTLHPGGSRPRRRKARQNRNLQQLTAFRQSSNSKLVGEGVGEVEDPSGEEQSLVHIHHGQVPSGIPVGRQLVGLARSSHLSIETWRRIRRSIQWASRSQCGQRSRTMENRQLSEEIWQSGETARSIRSVAAVGPRVLQKISGADGTGCGRSSCPMQPLSPLWQPWRAVQGQCVLEVFAGSGRLCSQLRRDGFRAFPIDTCLHSEDDVLGCSTENSIVELLLSGKVMLLWLGMPCTSFSIARRNDGIGPGPLRSDSCPMGIPGLSKSDQRQVALGNAMLMFSIRLIVICLALKIPFVLENPFSSRCWITPIMQQLLRVSVCKLLHLDFCCFGEPWKKPTGLLHAFLDLSEVEKICKGTGGFCSNTNKRHIALKGKAPDGRFMTLVAQPYPIKLVQQLSKIFSQQLL